MAYKTILAHVDSFSPSLDHIVYAIATAKQHDAHLIGLAPSGFASLPAGDYFGASARYIGEMQQELDEGATKAATIFADECKRQGLASYEAREATDSVIQAMLLSAGYADLVVVSQPAEDAASTLAGPGFVGDLWLEGCRPVMVLPNSKLSAPPIRNVLVAWDGSREAARAVTDAMPLLLAAAQVEVVAVIPGESSTSHGAEPGSDLAVFLARHGVKANVNQVVAQASITDTLLGQITALDADLIVMGGYGHSRLREWVLGGTTRDMLAKMKVPALMSH